MVAETRRGDAVTTGQQGVLLDVAKVYCVKRMEPGDVITQPTQATHPRPRT